MNSLAGKGRPARGVENSVVLVVVSVKRWKPNIPSPFWIFKTCYRENFTILWRLETYFDGYHILIDSGYYRTLCPSSLIVCIILLVETSENSNQFFIKKKYIPQRQRWNMFRTKDTNFVKLKVYLYKSYPAAGNYDL